MNDPQIFPRTKTRFNLELNEEADWLNFMPALNMCTKYEDVKYV